MKLGILFFVSIVIGGFSIFSACTININQNTNANQNIARTTPANITTQSPSAAASKPVSASWSVAVCSSRASSVTLQAGASKDDTQTFATWTEGSPKIFPLPERVQNLTEVYFHAIGSEPKPVELCVLFNGRPKRRVAFEEGGEGNIVGASDDDDEDCRCTQ